MHGIILNRYWNGGTNPVQVTETGTLTKMRGVTKVDPTNAADAWARDRISVVEPTRVLSNATGRYLMAQICKYS